MSTDPQSLITSGKCFACYGASVFQVMKLSLLASISQARNPANQVDPASLIAQGKCFPCFSNASLIDVMVLALLNQIASS
jgi:hypothetical protein